MMERILSKRLAMLERNVKLIQQRKAKYPQGYLKIDEKRGRFYYSIVDIESGESRYVTKGCINEARMIAQRDYEAAYLKTVQSEICELEKLLSQKYYDKAKGCYSNLHPGRKCLVVPYEMSDEEYISRWIGTPYIPKGFSEDDETAYYTEKGERVRSKAEVIIADTLNSLNIPYKYECPLQLDNITIYPDFTILDIIERREKYFEHFGMLGDPDYVSNMLLKLSTYERNGIYVGSQLICTLESVKRPLDVRVLRNKLATLLMSD